MSMESTTKPPRILGTDAARALGRFNPDGVVGYRAATAPGAPLRATRAEAMEDELRWLEPLTEGAS